MAERPRAAPPEEDSLCDLATGRVAAWRGLAPFDPARVPACFGTRVDVGMVTLHDLDWHVQHFRSTLAEAWLYDDGSTVALISVFPSSPPTISPLEATLGSPQRREVRFAERIERDAQPPLLDYDGEMVYAERGLALLIATGDAGLRVAYRLRGFAPTDAGGYFGRFVQARPIEWQMP